MARRKAQNPAATAEAPTLPAAESFLDGQQTQAPPPPPVAPTENVVGAITREVVTKDKVTLAPNVTPRQAPAPVNGRHTGRVIPGPFEGSKAKETIDAMGYGELEGEHGFAVRATKITPNFKELGTSIPQGTVADIRQCLAAMEGPGIYVLKLSQHGVDCGGVEWQIRMTITADEAANLAGKSTVAPAQQTHDDSIDQEIQRTEKTVALTRKKGELRKTQAELDREEQRLREEETRRVTAPIDAMREEMRTFMSGMKEIVTAQTQAIAQANSKPPVDITALITALAPILTAVIGQKKDGPDLEKLIVLLNGANEKMISAIMTAVKEKPQDEGMMKLLFKEVIIDKIKNEKNPLDELLKMKKIMQEFEPQPEPDVEIDPNNITGSLFAQGIAGLIRAFRSGAAKDVIAAVVQGVGKPPEQVTDTDIAALAHQNPQLTQQFAQQPQRQLPPVKAPPPIQKLPPPVVHNPLQQTTPVAASEVLPAPVTAPATQPPVDNVGEVPSTPITSTAEEIEIEDTPKAPTQTDLEKDLRYEINSSVSEMILDIEAGRTEYQWVYNAVNRWHRSYLENLSAMTNDPERMKSVREKADPELWKKLDEALAKAGGSAYSYFFASFGTLTAMFVEGKAAEQQQAAPQPNAAAQ